MRGGNRSVPMALMNMFKGQKRRGGAAVESAIVMPIIVLLVFGVVEYGWMMLKSQDLSNAARSGARAGVRYGANATTVNNAISTAMTNAGLAGSGYVATLTPVD